MVCQLCTLWWCELLCTMWWCACCVLCDGVTVVYYVMVWLLCTQCASSPVSAHYSITVTPSHSTLYSHTITPVHNSAHHHTMWHNSHTITQYIMLGTPSPQQLSHHHTVHNSHTYMCTCTWYHTLYTPVLCHMSTPVVYCVMVVPLLSYCVITVTPCCVLCDGVHCCVHMWWCDCLCTVWWSTRTPLCTMKDGQQVPESTVYCCDGVTVVY